MVQLVTHIVWQHLKAKHLLQMPQHGKGSHVDLIAAALHTPKMPEFDPKKLKKRRSSSARRICGGTAEDLTIGAALRALGTIHCRTWSFQSCSELGQPR